MSNNKKIFTSLFYDNEELNKFSIENYNIFYSHKLISYLEHLIYVLERKHRTLKYYYERCSLSDAEQKGKHLNIYEVNKSIIVNKKKLKLSKELIGKIEPLIIILNPDYISTSSKSVSTYFLYFNKDLKEIINKLDNLNIKYVNKYIENSKENELVKIRFSNHDYIKDELNNEFVNDDLFIDVRIKDINLV